MSETQAPLRGEATELPLPPEEARSFGACLRSVRKARGISLRCFARQLGKTPTYLSDIENGFSKPPDRALLAEMIAALELPNGAEERELLYDLAAAERDDIPADVKALLYENPAFIPLLRRASALPEGDALFRQMDAQLRGAV